MGQAARSNPYRNPRDSAAALLGDARYNTSNLHCLSRSIGAHITTVTLKLPQPPLLCLRHFLQPAYNLPINNKTKQTHQNLYTKMSRFLPLRPLRAPRPALRPIRPYSSSFLQNSPAPPRLPADQQAEFERLQRAAAATLNSHTSIPSSISIDPLATSRHVTTPSPKSNPQAQVQEPPTLHRAPSPVDFVTAGTFSGGIRGGAPPEFEGDKNPKTGEIGGPKNEPLRWGPEGDWSFNGRVTDF